MPHNSSELEVIISALHMSSQQDAGWGGGLQPDDYDTVSD